MRRHLKNKEIRLLISEIQERYNLEFFTKKDKVEISDNLLFVNNELTFFYYGQVLVPVLKLLLKNNFLKKITVDMGAVKFVASGADVMRPGIVGVDEEIAQGDIVSIIDEKNKMPLGIGEAMLSGEELMAKDSGKVIKTIHYVGDEIWNS